MSWWTALLLQIRIVLLAAVTPILRWLSSHHLPDTIKNITYKDVMACQKLWRPGDILLSRIDGEGSDLVINGFLKHSALLVDDTLVIQATNPGVFPSYVADFFLTKDAICLMRPKFATAEDGKAAVAWAMTQVGKPYDYHLDDSLAAFYCSKLVFDSYGMTMGDRCPVSLHSDVFGGKVIEPQNFYEDTAHFECLYKAGTDIPEPIS